MPVLQRRQSRRNIGGDGSGPISPSEFFRPAPIQKSRTRRFRQAMKRWLNGLPTEPDEDVLRGIESEQAISQPIVTEVPEEERRRVGRKRDLLRWRRRRAVPVVVEEEELPKSSSSSLKKGKKKENEKNGEEHVPIRVIQVPPPHHHTHLLWPQETNGNNDMNPYGVSNRIRTAKYSLLTFLPKNLAEQFRRVANVYFLFIVILQAIPVISNYNVGLAALPLIIIVSITAAKDALEDWKRHTQDKSVNFAWTRTLRHPDVIPLEPEERRGRWWDIFFFWRKQATLEESSHLPVEKVEWERRHWQDVRVGDILYLEGNEMIPADLVILATSEPDSVCYVETKNLDGETNLKVKRGPEATSWIQSADDAAEFRGQLEVELPTSSLYAFCGRMLLPRRTCATDEEDESEACGATCDDSDDGKSTKNPFEVVVPLDTSALLLRGCIVRNTHHVIGVVVYTGPHTKLMLNAGGTPSKRSRIERQMDPQIILNFVLLFLICVVCAVVQGVLAAGMMAKAPYWVASFEGGGYSPTMAGFLTFWSSVILFQTLVPISLYLTVELCKTAQAFLIHSDAEMWHTETGTGCVPRAWNISDDLGQIQYLFSDKTGTLTRNVMEFRRVSIRGRVYGVLEGEVASAEAWTALEDEQSQKIAQLVGHEYIPPTRHALVDPQLLADLEVGGEQAEAICDFFTLLIVCHTVLIERLDTDPSSDALPHQLLYKAQSPDEAALVATSRDLGFVFLGREQDRLRISVPGRGPESLQILHVLEFNSDRKRMSIVVRRADGRLQLMTKGADNVIYERLESSDNEECITCLQHLERFAEDGLRTLCLAQRDLSPSEYSAWHELYTQAAASIHDRELQVAAVCDGLEKGFHLLGATAIEDRLQEGVPECIERLQLAGIRVWVLTGDKLETAINIGFACKLLRKDMLLLTVRSTDVDSTREQLRLAYEQVWRHHLGLAEMTGDEVPRFALIIEGTSLRHAFAPTCRTLFMDLAARCTAVICCRVSPLQKAKVVELMKRGRHAMTMAIGDGANDVSMIQAADVGVGIAGQEGMQAVMASDYAIGQFRFLERLLLVHGRWSYIRTAEVTLASFYKNILFVVLLFWYQFYCGFTAEYVYDYMYLLLFNLLFSVAPLLVLGCVDRDLEARTLTRVPPVYALGIKQKSYSMGLFALYVLDALYQSMVCFWVPLAAYGDVGLVEAGYVENKALVGNVMALAVILSVNLYIALNTFSWTALTFLSLPIAFLLPILALCLYGLLPTQDLYGTWRVLLQPLCWATLLLTVVLALTPRLLAKYIQSQFKPTDLDVCREVCKYGGVGGEDRLTRTIDVLREGGDGKGGSDMTTIPIVSPPPKALHREGSQDLPSNTSNEMISKAPPVLHRAPSSSALLRQRLVPLGSTRSPNLRVFNLRTGRFERINGFAYSQDEGMRGLIEGRARLPRPAPTQPVQPALLAGYRSPTVPKPSTHR